MSNDFKGFEFAAGDVRGTRCWKVDMQGRLRGVVMERVWRPGENVAVCLREHPGGGMAIAPSQVQVQYFGTNTTFTMNSAGVVSAAGLSGPPGANANARYCSCGCGQLVRLNPCHDMEIDCTCGFYAYQEGSNDYYMPGVSKASSGSGPVGGVIRGYGKVVLCTRGFRAEKAEILALYVDGEQLRQSSSQVKDSLIRHRVERNYNVPVFEDYLAMLEEFPPDMPEQGDGFWDDPNGKAA